MERPWVCYAFPLCLSFKTLLRSSSSVKAALILLSSQWRLLALTSQCLPCSGADSRACLVSKRLSRNARGMKECGRGEQCGVTLLPGTVGYLGAVPGNLRASLSFPSCRRGRRGLPYTLPRLGEVLLYAKHPTALVPSCRGPLIRQSICTLPCILHP